MRLTQQERASMAAQLIAKLLPVYGPFPLPETVEAHRQLALRAQRRSVQSRLRHRAARDRETQRQAV